MKKFIQYQIILLSAVLTLTACDEWLEVTPPSNISTENFYTNATEAEQALYGVYNGLMPLSYYSWLMSDLRSDDVWADDAEDSATQRDYLDIFSFNPNIVTISTLNDAWVDLYEIVARANVLLQKIESTTFEEMDGLDLRTQFKAEARLLRGYAYFELVRYFGRVPIVLTPQTVEEAMQTPQSEDWEVYEQVIIPDLQYAADNLGEVIYTAKGKEAASGRANRVAARALLGRVYVTMAGFPLYDTARIDSAAIELEWVIDYAETNKKYWAKTATDWLKIWISDNDNLNHIFEIQYIAKEGYGNPMVYWTAPGVGADYIDLKMSGYNLSGTKALISLLSTDVNGDLQFDDVRREGTLDFEFSASTRFFSKFFEHKKKRAALGYADNTSQVVNRNYFPINYPIIRLEDVMLMYAELLGATDEGVALVNKIRTRAGLPELNAAEKADFQQTVADERRRELAGEGIRWHDLVRRNEYRDALRGKFINYATDAAGAITRPKVYQMASRVTEGNYLYPIPDVQMKTKEGLYEQNEAYK